MSKRQLFALCTCSLVSFTIGNALAGLMPIYVARFDTTSSAAGNFMASALFALSVGTLAGGWLSDRFQRRRIFIITGGLINIPATWLMGQATELWQLVVLGIVVWFVAGISLSMGAILVGLFADKAERGKVFGAIGLTVALGALLGGATSGVIVKQSGYPALFLACSLCWIIQPIAGLLIQDKVIVQSRRGQPVGIQSRLPLGSAFYVLLLASLVFSIGGFVAGLGRPLLMNRIGFDSEAITSAVGVSGAVSLPFPFLLGWLSDRLGRYRLLALCYVFSALGLVVLAGSTALWQFWLSAVLGAAITAGGALAQALVTDLVPPESLGLGLSRLGAVSWAAGVIGNVGTGYAIQGLGMTVTLVLGAALTLCSIVLLLQVQRVRRLALA